MPLFWLSMAGRAVGYLRRKGVAVSDIWAQFAALAKANALELLDIIVDLPTVSPADKSAKFADVIVGLHAGNATAVIIENLASLSDDLIDQEIILGHLQRWGMSVFSVNDPDLSVGDPKRKLLREFASRSALSGRLNALRLQGRRIEAARRSGKAVGPKPYGELPGEADTLAQIRQFNADGLSATEISRHLNAMQINTRHGKQWHRTTVANMLGARREKAARKARKQRKGPIL